MTYENILYEIEDSILTITINRPDKLNALNAPTIGELIDAVAKAKTESNLKGMIVTGAGSKAFVAGADISEFQGLDPDSAKALAQRGHDLFRAIEELPFIVVAAVNGFALGGGCELALACHLRIGSDQARMGLPEVGLGLIPGYGGTQRMTQVIGKGRAIEMITTAKMIDAATALDYGLLNEVTAPEELIPTVRKLIGKIGSKGPVAVAKALKCVNAFYAHDKDGFAHEVESFGVLFNTEDVVEGAKAFLEKRKPEFKGK